MELLLNRIPRALLVALLVGGLLGGAVGFATADTEPVPETFSVAEPMIGDRWQYDLRAVVTGPDEVAEETATATYTYGEPFDWHDAEGIAYRVVPLKETVVWAEDGDQASWEDVYYVDAETGRVVGSLGVYEAAFVSRIESLSIGQTGLTTRQNEVKDVQVEYFDEVDPFCGYRSPLQGAFEISTKDVVFGGACTTIDSDEELTFDAQQVGTIEGLQAIRFQSESSNATIDLWMARAVPYPLRMEIHEFADLSIIFGDLAPGEAIVTFDITWDLVGFEAGSQPWGTGVAAADLAVSPITLAPRQVWGPDDTGVDIPYRLQEAFEGARDSPTYPDLRTYLLQHPEAQVVFAEHYHEEDATGEQLLVWRFVLSDGEQMHETIARRSLAADGSPQATLDDLAGPRDTYETPDDTFWDFWVQFYPTPEQLPDRLPTIQSGLQRFEEVYGQAGNAWGFTTSCWLECSANVLVGHSQRTYQAGDPLSPAPYDGQYELLEFDADGTPTSHQIWTEEFRPSRTIGPASGIQMSTQPHTTRPIEVAAIGWEMPPAPVAASLGFIGLLAGMLYWLWPVLKSLPFFGMFSRVHGTQLLEHPVRAEIMDAIQSRPGTHYQQLVTQLGKGRGTMEHHLRKLEASGLIVSRKTAGYTCYYVKGAVDRRVMEGLHTIKSGTAARMLEEILASPGITAKEMCLKLGISPSTASHHLSRMREAGLIDAQGNRNAALHPTDLSKDALATRLT